MYQEGGCLIFLTNVFYPAADKRIITKSYSACIRRGGGCLICQENNPGQRIITSKSNIGRVHGGCLIFPDKINADKCMLRTSLI